MFILSGGQCHKQILVILAPGIFLLLFSILNLYFIWSWNGHYFFKLLSICPCVVWTLTGVNLTSMRSASPAGSTGLGGELFSFLLALAPCQTHRHTTVKDHSTKYPPLQVILSFWRYQPGGRVKWFTVDFIFKEQPLRECSHLKNNSQDKVNYDKKWKAVHNSKVELK